MRKLIWIFTGMAVCLSLICLGGIVFYSVLPKLVQSRLISEITEKTGLSRVDMDIRKLDLFGFDVANIKMGGDDHHSITVQTVQLDYSPRTLFKKQVKSISLNGINLFCRYENGQWSAPGVFSFPQDSDPLSRADSEKSSQGRGAAADLVSILKGTGIETIEIGNVNLYMTYEDKQFQIPMEAFIRGFQNKSHLLDCEVKLQPFGQPITIKAEMDWKHNKVKLGLNANDLLLGAFAEVFSLVPDLAAAGHAEISANSELDLSAGKFENTSIGIQINDFNVKLKDTVLTNTVESQDSKTAYFHLFNKQHRQWEATMSAMSVAQSFPDKVSGDIKDFYVRINLLNKKLKADGRFTLVINDPVQKYYMRKKGDSPFQMNTVFEATLDGNRNWGFKVNNAETESNTNRQWQLLVNGFEVLTPEPIIRLKGKGRGLTGHMDATVSFAKVSAQKDGRNFHIPELDLKGTASLEDGGIYTQGAIILSDVQVKTALFHATLPRMSLKGTTGNLLTKPVRFKGITSVSDASATSASPELRVSGVDFSLPVSWPDQRFDKPGELVIDSIQWKKKTVGKMYAEVRQKGLGLIFDGVHHNGMVRNLMVNFSGQGLFEDKGFVSEVRFEMVPHDIASPIDLGRFYSKAANTTLQGGLTLSGFFSLDGQKPECALNMGIENGRIAQADKSFVMEGINTQIFFPDVFQLKTAPEQVFSFQTAALANIKFEKGLIEFQLESKDSFFIEKTMFNWCNGHVETQALRILPENDKYEVVLYCDRLNLAMVLMQFGAAEAEGKGTVSGRIPLRYENGGWIFNDGFLYSSPGEGGRIKMRETEKWASAVPADTPRFDRIQLAQEAVKDYEYNWAKLGFHTEGEDLLLKLNFNGQPTNPIPFTYRKDLGKFVRITTQDVHGMRPEIFLDLNFRVPLNEVLHYRDFLNMIQ